MKQFKFVFLFILLIILFASCSQEIELFDPNPTINLDMRLTISYFDSLSVGAKHNVTCEEYFNTYDDTTDLHTADSLTSRAQRIFKSYSGDNIYISIAEKDSLIDLFDDNCSQEITMIESKDLVHDGITRSKNKIPITFDFSIVDSFNLMVINDDIDIPKLENLLGQKILTFYEDEMYSGMISILESSTELWTDYYNLDEDDVQGIVQADCLGYIFGWVGACLAENNENGKLDVKNQYKRMGIGALSGMAFSSGVSKRWRWSW